jgi:transcriptional regulator with PAS, ATPase and Fis domain
VTGNGLPPIIGVSPSMRLAVTLLERYAATPVPILLVGATGTGKELFAQHIHHRSGRSGEFVDIDCGALPRDMIEGLLLGYRRGAFTGAIVDRIGLIEQSDRGTLFFDEVLGLAEEGQRKLLRVLDTAEVRRLGDTGKRRVDLRLVAAVQEDVDERLAHGTFRRDLYERLSGVVIRLLPLAERRDDILPLARHFAGLQCQRLESDAERALEDYGWPGNVRELRKVIVRAGPLVANGTLSVAAVAEALALGPSRAQGPLRGVTPWHVLRQMTRSELRAKCAAHEWDSVRIAAALGVGRTTLFKQLRATGLSLKQESEFASPRGGADAD